VWPVPWVQSLAMNYRQQRFVNEYCIDQNGTQAAIRAGYSEGGAPQQACLLLSDPKIRESIDLRMQEIAIAAKIDAVWVLRKWHDIVEADSNELMQVRRVGCRHCHGYGHAYQWTEVEYSKAVDEAITAGKEIPDGMGGFGFDRNAEPHLDCPECGGLGDEQVFIADTRTLVGMARSLYAGVQKTKDGIKILTRDKDAALANISKYLGMNVERKEISGPGGKPLTLAHIKAEDLTDDQLAVIIAGEASDNQS
jgi:phage terminase small subunit